MCCYTGGFALNAARVHALEVTGVDSSSPAMELANQNIALNNLDPGRISFLKQDATAFMKSTASRNEARDIVILDPPKLAPRRKELKLPGHVVNKTRRVSDDLLMFRSYDVKWPVLTCSSG
uniref:Ribosomal RNA large subunit methyltransferase I n=1 Tax=Tanacetum cinerariifolium TaxID=118510 RepID=A0A699JWN9_TANCI|nr:ribosomal RNA large subunit methyltransferase I [Tanacetum cinerariifolium]